MLYTGNIKIFTELVHNQKIKERLKKWQLNELIMLIDNEE